MYSRSLCGGPIATGAVVRMQPDKASAVMAAMIGSRNARATRTGAIPHSETAPVLHRLWLTNRFAGGGTEHRRPVFRFMRSDQALTPAPIGHDTDRKSTRLNS